MKYFTTEMVPAPEIIKDGDKTVYNFNSEENDEALREMGYLPESELPLEDVIAYYTSIFPAVWDKIIL